MSPPHPMEALTRALATRQIQQAAETLWNYHLLFQQLAPGDAICALGSNDLRTAVWAAELFHAGWAPRVICSGAFGNLTRGVWRETEAVRLCRIVRSCGVPSGAVFLESRSTNTGENIRFLKAFLKENGLPADRLIFVHKPFMERRTLATVEVVWPEVTACVTSPPYSLRDYATARMPLPQVVTIMVGDFQRLLLYPLKGYQAPQDVPSEVLRAYLLLVRSGFTGHLLPGEPLLPRSETGH